jgi:hypothetical protein
MLKVDNATETLINSLISRANTEVLLIECARRLARENSTTLDYEYNQLIESRNKIYQDVVDNMQKFV